MEAHAELRQQVDGEAAARIAVRHDDQTGPRLEAAHSLLARAARICNETGNQRVGAQVRQRLGALHLLRGEFGLSADMYARVLEAVRESGDRIGECHALLGMAAVDVRRGKPLRAAQILAEVLELTMTVGDPMVKSRVMLALAEANLAASELDTAAGYADRAMYVFEELGAALFCARTLVVRGRIHQAVGSPGQAMAAWRTAAGLLS